MRIPWRKLLIGEFSWKRIFRSLAVIYGILFVGACTLSEKLIFPYRGSSYGEHLPGLQLLRSGDGQEIATRYLKAPNEEYVVLHFHGNYEDLGQLDPMFMEFRARRWSVLALDYRGYGLSKGSPKEATCYLDGERLYQRAIELGYDPGQIIIWGRSVGGGLAVELALRRKAHALVLESPFATAFTVATKVPVVPFDRFDNLGKIGSVDEPLFILHGSEDRLISPRHSRKLHDAHPGPKERHLIADAGHNDLWDRSLDVELTALSDFLSR